MAVSDQTAHKTDGTFISLGNAVDGYRLTGLKELGEIAVTGTSTQIDTTGYQGNSKTYAKGKNDPGTYSATANAALQHPIFGWLEEKQRAGTAHTLSVLIGNMNENTGLADGTAADVASGLICSVTAGTGQTPDKVVLAPVHAANSPGITRGDYIATYNASAAKPTTGYGKVDAVAIEASGDDAGQATFTLAGNGTVTSGNVRAAVVRPPTLFQIQVLVMKVAYMPPADGIVEASIELQATGEGHRYLGEPNLGATWSAVQTAYGLPANF